MNEVMDEATVKKFRGRAKSALTRLINSFSEHLDITELISRRDRLDQIFKEFDQYDAALPDDQSEIEDFENKYFEIKAKYQNAINALSGTNLNINPLSTLNTVSVESANNSFKLPRLNIPKFSGEYTDWLNFKDLYLATVHNNKSLAKIQKFQYLIGLLADEPASIIKHIPISETTYEEAWNKLLNRYDRKNQIVTSLIKTFLDQSPISHANSDNLRRIADTSDEVIRGLKSLGEAASSRDIWLIYLLLQKVDTETRHLWSQKTIDNEFPSLDSFIEFLNARCVSLEIFNSNDCERKTNVRNQNTESKMLFSKSKSSRCYLCNGSHSLFNCYKFKSLDIQSRKNIIRQHSLCYNCFGPHALKYCPSIKMCNICKNKHNTLIHEDFKPAKNVVSNSSSIKEESKVENESVNISCNAVQGHNISILPTAIVTIFDVSGQGHKCALLLDSGSEVSFISEALVRKIGVKRSNARINVKGLGAVDSAVTHGSVNINIASIYCSKQNCVSINALVLDKLTCDLPSEFIRNEDLNYLSSINLADPNFSQPKKIDIIIGADYFFRFLLPGQIIKSVNDPIAQNTIFSWVVSGKMKDKNNDSFDVKTYRISLSCDNSIDLTLKRFWELEEIPSKISFLSEEEEFCELHFKKNYQINAEGRFVVRLPILSDTNKLRNSRQLAISRFLSMERKFVKSENMEREYKNFMLEYLKLRHMNLVTKEDHLLSNSRVHYLPHHAVIKPSSSSTKLRVVFDGSCKVENSMSLNSILGVGPTIQRDIFSILANFRMHKISFSADIEKMYRQILIAEEDQNLQRIVWRDSQDLVLQDYKLCTVTYGTASAPFLATRCLQQIAFDNEVHHPEIASVIKNEFYIDDCLSGSSTLEEAIDKAVKLTEVLGKRGFHLRKWRSNSTSLLEHLSSENEEQDNLEIQTDDCAKTLGLYWNSKEDYLKFKVSFEFEGEITKRTFLSQSAKLFDPLGLLSASTVIIKIFYQQLWLLKLDWDSPLPDEWKKKLHNYQIQFKALENVRIPRWLQTKSKSICLYGFCDASELAYSAIIYCSQVDQTDPTVNIMVAKTKVAPMKQISICRLELLGAVLLARLFAAVLKALPGYDVSFRAWTDSKVVLSCSFHPRKWKLFVANRTSEILEVIPYEQWSHVSSKQNPADLSSRGVDPQNLVNSSLWWHGPPFLTLDKNHWPEQRLSEFDGNENTLSELKLKSVFKASTVIPNDIFDTLFENIS